MAATRCVSLMALAMLASSGCGFVELPSLDGRPADVRLVEEDGCELHVLRQEGDWIEEMEHPYVTNMVPTGMAAPPVAITLAEPGGGRSRSWSSRRTGSWMTPIEAMDRESSSPTSSHSQSTFRALGGSASTELTAGCGREFSVEVRQPG